MASLYVGDLHPDVTEYILFNKFASVRAASSIKICRNRNTQQSLGYAYVNFENAEDAELALAILNFEEINGRPMRIMRSQRDKSLRQSNVGNVYIKNLDKNIDHKKLYDVFSVYGNILSCKIAQDENGVSKTYGFVHFDTEEAAKNAIQSGNGMLVNDKPVEVTPFISRKNRNRERNERFANLYVKNFGKDLTDAMLKEMFSKYGTITSYKIMRNSNGKSREFGFVAFENSESAESAILELNGKEIVEGKPMYVARVQTKEARQQQLKRQDEQLQIEQDRAVNLDVNNLDSSNNDEQLRQMFKQFHTGTSAKVMLEEGPSKGSKHPHMALAEHKEMGRTQLASQFTDMNNASENFVPQLLYWPLPWSDTQGDTFAYTGIYNAFHQVVCAPGQAGATCNGLSSLEWQLQQMTTEQLPPVQQALYIEGHEPLTVTMLAAASPEEQKQMLGERLFPLIEGMYKDMAGEITGMLLEIDSGELLYMLEERQVLKIRVEEAVEVLRAHEAKKQ